MKLHANCLQRETICMKYQILFSRKNKKNISKCLLKFLPSMQGVKKLLWLLPVHRTGENLVGPVLEKKKGIYFTCPELNLNTILKSSFAHIISSMVIYFFYIPIILYVIIQCQLSKLVTQTSLGHKNSQK